MSEQATNGETQSDQAAAEVPPVATGLTLEDVGASLPPALPCLLCGGTKQVSFEAAPNCVGVKACPACG